MVRFALVRHVVSTIFIHYVRDPMKALDHIRRIWNLDAATDRASPHKPSGASMNATNQSVLPFDLSLLSTEKLRALRALQRRFAELSAQPAGTNGTAHGAG
jgi:hypothetical protein